MHQNISYDKYTKNFGDNGNHPVEPLIKLSAYNSNASYAYEH